MRHSNITVFTLITMAVLLQSCMEKDPIINSGGNGGGDFVNYSVKIDYGYEDNMNEMKNTFYLLLQSGNTNTDVEYSITDYCISVNGTATNDKLFYIENGKISELEAITASPKRITFGNDGRVTFFMKDYKPSESVQVSWTVKCKVPSINKEYTYTSKDADRQFRGNVQAVLTPNYDFEALRYNITGTSDTPQKGDDGNFYLYIMRSDLNNAMPDHEYTIESITHVRPNTNDEPAEADYSVLVNGNYDSTASTFNFAKTQDGIITIKVKCSDIYDSRIFTLTYKDKWSETSSKIDFKYSGTTDYSIQVFADKDNIKADGTVLCIVPSEMLYRSGLSYSLRMNVQAEYNKNFENITGKDSNNEFVKINKSSNDFKVQFSTCNDTYTYKNKSYEHCYLIYLDNNLLNDRYTLSCTLRQANGDAINGAGTNTVIWGEPIREGLSLNIDIKLNQNGLKYTYSGIIASELSFNIQFGLSCVLGYYGGDTHYRYVLPSFSDTDGITNIPLRTCPDFAGAYLIAGDDDKKSVAGIFEKYASDLASASYMSNESDCGKEHSLIKTPSSNSDVDLLPLMFNKIQNQGFSITSSYGWIFMTDYQVYYVPAENSSYPTLLHMTDINIKSTFSNQEEVTIPVNITFSGEYEWTNLYLNSKHKEDGKYLQKSRKLDLTDCNIYIKEQNIGLDINDGKRVAKRTLVFPAMSKAGSIIN